MVGGYLTSDGVNKGGLNDSDGDENDVQAIDETMCRYDSSTLLSDDEFADLINSINAGQMIMVMVLQQRIHLQPEVVTASLGVLLPCKSY
jgi:hypothetical protein